MYGENMKQLSNAAMRILSIPPTASGGERNWSAFKHIWNDHRTNLLVGKVGMLVYIYFNSRALKRIKDQPSAADWEGFVEYMESLESAEEAEAETLAEAYDNAVAEIDGQVIDATSDAGESGNANGSFDSGSKDGLES